MRKSMNYFLSLFALASIIFLASCGDDTEVPLPGEITLNGNAIVDDTLRGTPGATVYVTPVLGIASDDTITVRSNGTSISVPSPNTVASGDSIGVVFAANAQAGATATLTFTSGSVNRQLITKVEVAPVNTATYETVLLMAPTGDRGSKSFFSAIDGKTYSVNEVNSTANASANIDFGYYYGDTNNASLASPSTYPAKVYDLGPTANNWGTRNGTMFLPVNNLTSEQFDDIADDGGARLAQEYEVASASGATPTAEITKLAVGQLYSFKVARGQYGVLRIDEIKPGLESNKSISLTVKVTEAQQ